MTGKRSEKGARLWVGTSGYSYPEWIEAGVYPPETKSAHMLGLYAHGFAATELNYTWYQLPKAAALSRMREQVPAGFKFAAKLTRTLTHEVDPAQWRTQVGLYRDGIAPLVQARQLLAVLVQLPPGFDRSRNHRSYLAALLDELAGLPVAVEFRHRSWIEDRVFDELARRRVALVTVDAPELPEAFPALEVVTSPDLFYLRFHGRNAVGWRSGNMLKKFDYSYTQEALEAWIRDRIRPMAEKAAAGAVFFNNHVRGQAARNALTLTRLLGREGLRVQEAAPP